MARKEMLDKLAMPASSAAEMEADQDLMMDMGDEMPVEDEEMVEDIEAGDEEEMDLFADFSDEEILEEARKRGLDMAGEEMPEEDMGDDEEDYEDEEEL